MMIKLGQIFVLLTTLFLSNQVLSENDKQRDNEKRPSRPAFTELDLNSDGRIELSEFKQHTIPQRSHEEIFGHLDANQDGAVSQEEFDNHKPPRRHKREKGSRNS